MHPELIGALARQHQAERLRRRHFRSRTGPQPPGDRTRLPVRHIRYSVGSALVLVGTRVLPPNQTDDEWDRPRVA
jgi:hypothetical protein